MLKLYWQTLKTMHKAPSLVDSFKDVTSIRFSFVGNEVDSSNNVANSTTSSATAHIEYLGELLPPFRLDPLPKYNERTQHRQCA